VVGCGRAAAAARWRAYSSGCSWSTWSATRPRRALEDVIQVGLLGIVADQVDVMKKTSTRKKAEVF
jgi:hypothetical protein